MVYAMFFLFGLASLMGQVLLLREVMVLFYGTEISIGLFFGGWLCGIGVGASVGARVVRDASRNWVGLFVHCLCLLGLSVILEILLVRNIPHLFGAGPAEIAPLHGILAAVPLTTFVPAFLTGFLFPVGCSGMATGNHAPPAANREDPKETPSCHRPSSLGTPEMRSDTGEVRPRLPDHDAKVLAGGVRGTGFFQKTGSPQNHSSTPAGYDRGIAHMYASEALGSLVAGLAFTFVLVRVFPALSIAALSALILSVGGTAYGLLRGNRSCLLSGVPVMLVSVAMLLPVGKALDDWSVKAAWEALHPGIELLTSRPTPYQQAEIGRLGRQFSFFGNGKIAASFPDPQVADRTAGLIMAQNPEAKKVLLIGGGIGSLVRSLLRHPIERLDVVEPDPWAFRIAEHYLPPHEASALKDPRVNLVFLDGRLFVNRLGERRYDVIAAMLPDPIAAVWNRYYTREFFTAAARALTPRGFFMTRVTSAENYWGSEVASYAGSVYHTLKKVFPVVMGTPGDETVFFAAATDDLLSLDPQTLFSRYRKPEGSVFEPVTFQTILPPKRTAFVEKQLADSPVIVNTDFEPVSTALAMMLWGRFAGTQRLETLNTIRRGGMLVYLIPLGLFVLGRLAFRARWGPREDREARFRTLLAMAAIGACAMGTQIVLIYGYQSLFGYVFERIGLVTAVFMCGLALGGLAMGTLLPRVSRKDTALVVVLGVFSGFALSLPAAFELLKNAGPSHVEAVMSGLILFSGCLTGAGFPLVASRHLELSLNPGESSGKTDAADHYGAAVGALITGALLVPLLGMGRSCTVLAMIAMAPAVMIAAEWIFPSVQPVLQGMFRPRRPSFPYIRVTWTLAFVVPAAMIWRLAVGSGGFQPTLKFDPGTLGKISGSTEFELKETPYPHYLGRSAERGSTVTLASYPVVADVKGFGGPMNLLVSITDKGAIMGVKLLESRETPQYLASLDQWLARFHGKSILDPDLGRIDALSGATITCKAVTETLSRTGQRIAGPILGMDQLIRTEDSTRALIDLLLDGRLAAVVSLLSLFVVAFYSRSRRLRLVCLVVSFLLLGWYLNAPFTCVDAASLLSGRLPGSGALWRVVLLFGVLGISCLWGQAWCGFLCPFGALQEFFLVRGLRRHPTPQVERAGRYVKFVLLAVLLTLFFLSDDTIWFSFSPLQHFFGWRMEPWVLVLSVTVLVASVFYFRFWCRYLCPAGAFLALFNRIRLLRRISPTPVPGRCDLGVDSADHVDCIRCHRCIQS